MSSKEVTSPRWINSARRACNGSSSSPCEFLRKLTMMTAMAPINTITPSIIRPILHLYVSNFHHDKITSHDHTNDCNNSEPAAKGPTIKETFDIFRADKP